MATSFQKLQELDLSRDEVDRIGAALKNQEFRKLFAEYVEELHDPKSKELYEKEVTELEKERGVDVTFIHPKPGYVIKTSVNGTEKGFINICVNEHINRPSSTPTARDGAKGLQWSLPHSLSPPREDIDKKGARCQVFDIVFHPDTLHLAEKSSAFRTMVNNTALDAIETNFDDVKLDTKNLKFPKLQYKGMAQACVVRKPSDTKPLERSPEEQQIYDKIFADVKNFNDNNKRKPKKSPKKTSSDDRSNYTIPKYVIKHRSHVDIQDFTESKDSKMNAATPKELVVDIDLPLLKSSGDITLDVTEKTVQLTSEKPAKYKLTLTLPYQVNETNGNAKFDKDVRKLVITLPVKRGVGLLADFGRDDSGVESDHGSPGTPESEEEYSEKTSDITLSSEINPSEYIVEKSTEFRTKFLDENVHYVVPEFTCHMFENNIAFTLNVKNVDDTSIGKFYDDAGSSIHMKFASVSASFFTTNYAFYVHLPLHKINADDVTIETWDNNVVLQFSCNICDSDLKSYFYGVDADNLTEKCIEEPSIINQMLQEIALAEEGRKKVESEVNFSSDDNSIETSTDGDKEKRMGDKKRYSNAIDIMGASYESSGDELSCSYSPSKGILKRFTSKRFSVGRSISESSLDDFVCSSSLENGPTSLDSAIPEDGEVSTSLKKTVRFNDAVMRQLFRSNSSILGQKKKNQRKAMKKKRAQERRHSESETSEVEGTKEGEQRTSEDDGKEDLGNRQEVTDEETDEQKEDFIHDIFHLDMDH